MSDRLYVYGLAAAGSAFDLQAAAVETPDAKIACVPAGPLAAIVSPISEGEIFSTRRNLLAHTRALEEAMTHGPILPVRFGVIATDLATLTRAIELQTDRLLALLQTIAGKAEFGVRVAWDRAIVMREIAQEAPHLAERQAALAEKPEAASYYERIDLGREVAERLSRKRSLEEARLFAILKRVASDSRLQGPDDDVQVLKADFLLTPLQEQELTRQVETIAAEAPWRLQLKVVGPAPPYNFVNLRLGLGDDQSTRAAA